MDNSCEWTIQGRKISFSLKVSKMLAMIFEESDKRNWDKTFFQKLVLISAHFRNSPDFILRYLEPVLEMVKNNIHPGMAFVLFEEYCNISFLAKTHAKESIKKRMAQERRISQIHQKRELFAKIRQEYEFEKKQKNGKSLYLLLEQYFPEAIDNDKMLENLRQQYYRTIRREIGVKKERIADEDLVIKEFLDCYLLDNLGLAERINDDWRFFELSVRYGKVRSRISRIMNRQKYEKKHTKSIIKRMKRKKKS